MTMDYDREYIMDHYRHPRNHGSLELPDAHAECVSPLCGDQVKMDLHITDSRIIAVRIQGRGCSISQAALSILSEMIEGQTIEEAAQMNHDDVLDALGIAVSPARTKCALLSLEVLHRCLAMAQAQQHHGQTVSAKK